MKEIIAYTETDPFALVSLMQVNKRWYSTINTGQNVESDWKRRCLKMGVKRKAKAKTWKEYYMYVSKNKCANCSKKSEARFGELLEKGPRWLKVCPKCQMKQGPYHTVTAEDVEKLHNVPPWTLYEARFMVWRSPGGEWKGHYLLSTILRLSQDSTHQRS